MESSKWRAEKGVGKDGEREDGQSRDRKGGLKRGRYSAKTKELVKGWVEVRESTQRRHKGRGEWGGGERRGNDDIRGEGIMDVASHDVSDPTDLG